jgi:hypothetical protein
MPLQPQDVNCFKLLETTFKNESDNVMVRSNDCEPNKCTLVGWVDKVLHKILLQKKSWMDWKGHEYDNSNLRPWITRQNSMMHT